MWRRPAGRTIGRVARRSSPVIVGRDPELAEIERARRAAAEGRPQIVIVRGEAGIGKSRLIEEALARARAHGDAVLHGACLDLDEDGLPYLPVIAAMRGLARTIPAEDLDALIGSAAADLAPLLPDLERSATGPLADRPATRGRSRDRPEHQTGTGVAVAEPAIEGPAIESGDGAGAAGPDDATSPAREPVPVTAASGVDRARLFERFLGLLGRLADRSPILAVVEDVHWIDPATRDLITFLVRNVTNERLVAIVTCRTDDLPASHPVAGWLAELGRVPGALRMDLERLSRPELELQLESIAERPLDAPVVDTIWRRSGGHPLFAEELLAADPSRSSSAAPPSLVDILLARVATLDPAALHVVRVLAIAARPIDERLLGLVVERSAVEVGQALRAASAGGVLVSLPDGRHGFRHELLREVVENELSAGERRAIHERLAEALEARPALGEPRPSDAAADLARHWFAADRPRDAHRAAIAAASAAEAVHAFADAERLLERAIALEADLPADGRPSGAERIAIRRRASTVADLAGNIPRAIELIGDALSLVDVTADPATAGLLHARLGYLTWASGEGERALGEHERAVQLVPPEPPSTERANVLGGLAGALMGLGRLAESRSVAEEAIACAVAAGAPLEESRARMMLGSDLVAAGDVAAGLVELRRAHELAGPDATELAVVSAHNLALNLLAADQLDEALAVAGTARQTARRGGLERRYGMELAALQGDIEFRLGRWDEADVTTTEGLALDQTGRGTPYLAVVRSRLLAHRGATAEADRRLAEIDADRLDPDLAVVRIVALVESAILRGDPARAEQLATGAIERFEDSGTEVWAVPLLAHGLRAIGDRLESARAGRDVAAERSLTAAAERLRAAGSYLSRAGTNGAVAAWLTTARAEASRIGPTLDPAPWAESVAAWDAAGDPAGSAYARLRLAETELRRTGIKADVSTELVAAWRVATRLGAAPLREQIETLARRARVVLALPAAEAIASADGAPPSEVATGGEAARPRDVAPAAATPRRPAHTLSAREIEVLRLVAAGRSNGEIGEELFITRKTAGVHVTHILDKLGVSNRVEAAMAAARLGLIDDLEATVDSDG